MKADWKDATKILPEKRIRVIVSDSTGGIRIGFYGRQSSICGSDKECWRCDELYSGMKQDGTCSVGCEREIQVSLWDDLPDSPLFKPLTW